MAPTKTEIFIQANQVGFDKVSKSVADLGSQLEKAFTKAPRGINQMSSQMSQLKSSVGDLTRAVGTFSTKVKNTEPAIGVFKDMGWNIKSIVTDMEKLIQIQLRWYGTRFVLDSIAQLTIGAASKTIE